MVHTEADGKYEIRNKANGVPAGHYQVAIRPKGEVNSSEDLVEMMSGKVVMAPPRKDIPVIYESPTESGLTADVVAGENPPFDFALTKRR